MCFVLTLNSCIYNAQAAEDTVMEKDFIYVDGIKYDYVIDKDGTIKIETDSSKVNGKLILNSEANGVVQVENTDGKLEKYEIEVNDLTIENVDIDIFEDDGDIYEEIDSMEELLTDEYECQAAATVTVTVISISTLLKVLLLIAQTVIIAGVVYYAATTVAEAIQNNDKKRNLYYCAYLRGKDVYISYKQSISFKKDMQDIQI